MEAAGARSGEEEWVKMGGGSQFVPVSVQRGTRVEPRVGQLVVCGRLTGWQAG